MVPASTSPTAARPLLVHHVAKRLGVPRRTVRYWAATGRIPAIKAGPKIWKFRPSDVELFSLMQGLARCRRPARRTARRAWR